MLPVKVDPAQMAVVIEEEMEDCTIESIASELPGMWPAASLRCRVQPSLPCVQLLPKARRWSCELSFGLHLLLPLRFNCYCNLPSSRQPGVKPEQNMIYAGTKPAVVLALQITKVCPNPVATHC
jgi:hypothetical protein